MNKEAAINAMTQGGYKVAHRFFSDDEWIMQLEEEYITDEEGYKLLVEEFWACRTEPYWDRDWKIVG